MGKDNKENKDKVKAYYIHDLKKTTGSYLIEIPDGYEIAGELLDVGDGLVAIPVEKK